MESAEVELVDESRDLTHEVPAPATPVRMPSGTLAPPIREAGDGLDALRAEAEQLDTLGHLGEAIAAWRDVLAIDPADLLALAALESLFERDGRGIRAETRGVVLRGE